MVIMYAGLIKVVELEGKLVIQYGKHTFTSFKDASVAVNILFIAGKIDRGIYITLLKDLIEVSEWVE